MKANDVISEFFDSLPPVKAEDEMDERCMEHYLKTLTSVSKLFDESIYVLDLQKRRFVFVSDHKLFLCGRTPDEAMQTGVKHYSELIHPKLNPKSYHHDFN